MRHCQKCAYILLDSDCIRIASAFDGKNLDLVYINLCRRCGNRNQITKRIISLPDEIC